MILWEGSIQVRVSRIDPYTHISDDYWLDNLDKGTCIAVYTAFIPWITSLVNFFASSKSCVILEIDVKELIDLSANDIQLSDAIKLIK